MAKKPDKKKGLNTPTHEKAINLLTDYHRKIKHYGDWWAWEDEESNKGKRELLLPIADFL